MDWCCPDDRTALDPEALLCPTCGRRFGAEAGQDDFPVFATSDVTSPRPRLEQLWASMQRQGADAAATAYCEAHGCVQGPLGSDWKFFLPTPSDGTVLEIGAGIGDDTEDLLQRAGRVVAVVPHLTNARILRARLTAEPSARASIVVIDDLARLPLPDAGIAAIAMEQAGAAAYDLRGAAFDRAAAEWRRVLRPGGTVFLGVPNPFGARLISAIGAGSGKETMNRSVKQAAGSDHQMPRLGALVDRMVGQGFSAPAIHAPLPSEKRTQLVVPVEDRAVVRYCLDHLVRQNSVAVRLGVRVAGWAVDLGLFRHFVPYYFLLFRLAPES